MVESNYFVFSSISPVLWSSILLCAYQNGYQFASSEETCVYFVEMCLFCPYMVLMLTALIMWFLFCDWIFGFKPISEDEADDLGFLEDCKRVITRVVYTLTPLTAAVVVAYALGL